MNDAPPKKATLRQVVPFLAVSDMSRSRAFYLEKLAFESKNEWVVDGEIRWCWLTRDGISLMLQHFTAGPNALPNDVPRGVGVSLNVICDDAVAVYDEAIARGLEASEPEVGNGMWYTIVRDPDGYKLDFESPTDVPEDTKLSEIRPLRAV